MKFTKNPLREVVLKKSKPIIEHGWAEKYKQVPDYYDVVCNRPQI